MTDHRADFSKRLVIERRIELRFGKIGAERSADLYRLDRPAAGRAAPPVVDEFTHGYAECFFDKAATPDIAGELERERALGSIDSHAGVTLRAQVDDIRYRRERDDVVDDGGFAEQTFDRR